MLGTFPEPPHNEEKRRQKTADYGSVFVDIGGKANVLKGVLDSLSYSFYLSLA